MNQPTSPTPLRILIVAAEMTPFVKTGGVADVIGALPHALHLAGHEVRVIIPKYGWIDTQQFGLQPLAEAVQVPIDDGIDMAELWQCA